jgi:Kef-type K+ transport system membrane component KefB
MQTILELAELSGLLGLAFSVALLFEWALLRAIFGAIAAGLRPATVSPREVRAVKVRK